MRYQKTLSRPRGPHSWTRQRLQRGQTLVEYLIVMAGLMVVYVATDFMVTELGAFNASQSESLRAIY